MHWRFSDAINAASDPETIRCIGELSDCQTDAPDPERSDALAKLSDAEGAAPDAETIECTDDCLIFRLLPGCRANKLLTELTQTWRDVKNFADNAAKQNKTLIFLIVTVFKKTCQEAVLMIADAEQKYELVCKLSTLFWTVPRRKSCQKKIEITDSIKILNRSQKKSCQKNIEIKSPVNWSEIWAVPRKNPVREEILQLLFVDLHLVDLCIA